MLPRTYKNHPIWSRWSWVNKVPIAGSNLGTLNVLCIVLWVTINYNLLRLFKLIATYKISEVSSWPNEAIYMRDISHWTKSLFYFNSFQTTFTEYELETTGGLELGPSKWVPIKLTTTTIAELRKQRLLLKLLTAFWNQLRS